MLQHPGPTVGDFLAHLEAVGWFARVGCPSAEDDRVARLRVWEEWPGPDQSGVLELSFRHQELYDHILAEAGEHKPALTALWERIHAVVFRQAAPAVPFDPTRDAYHAPTAAVWQAAWTAGLVGLCLRTGRPVPLDLLEQWAWFARGHWPCGVRMVF